MQPEAFFTVIPVLITISFADTTAFLLTAVAVALHDFGDNLGEGGVQEEEGWNGDNHDDGDVLEEIAIVVLNLPSKKATISKGIVIWNEKSWFLCIVPRTRTNVTL